MKNFVMMIGVMLAAVTAFAGNAYYPDTQCPGRDVLADFMDTNPTDEEVGEYILTNMAEPMKSKSDKQALKDINCYATFWVHGIHLVDFIWAHADALPDVAQQKELIRFANRVEKVSKQAAIDYILEKIPPEKTWTFLTNFTLGNLVDPMNELSDQEAAPRARIYKQLKVGNQNLLEFLHRNYRGRAFDDFSERVERLAK